MTPIQVRARDLECKEFTESATIRLISTAYIDEPVLAPLVDDADELAILESLEAQTSSRLLLKLPVPGGLDKAELLNASHGYGWTYVNAAFCYTRTTGNRFNGPERGAWYAAYGINAVTTAQSEVSWHLTRELEATGIFENITAYRELVAGFTAKFYVLERPQGDSALNANPALAYPIGQALARDVLHSGGNGMLYPSVRHRGGKCLVALRPYLVQNIRQGNTWVFEWSGTPNPSISSA